METCGLARRQIVWSVAHRPVAYPEPGKSGGIYIKRRGTDSLLTELLTLNFELFSPGGMDR
jgi:hypothetical protein